MGSGKRASMREGPLADLFRKTETEGLESKPAAPAEEPEARAPEPISANMVCTSRARTSRPLMR